MYFNYLTELIGSLEGRLRRKEKKVRLKAGKNLLGSATSLSHMKQRFLTMASISVHFFVI